jgi:hypothetical protein
MDANCDDPGLFDPHLNAYWVSYPLEPGLSLLH